MDAWRTGSALSSLLRIVSTSRCCSTNKRDLSFTSWSSFSNAPILYSVNACDSQLCGLFSICCRKIGNFGENTNTQFPLVRKKFHSNSAFIFRHNFKETRGIYIVLQIWNFNQKQWRQHECFWSKRSCWQLQIPIWQLLPEHDVIHFAVNQNRHRFVSFRVLAPIS